MPNSSVPPLSSLSKMMLERVEAAMLAGEYVDAFEYVVTVASVDHHQEITLALAGTVLDIIGAIRLAPGALKTKVRILEVSRGVNTYIDYKALRQCFDQKILVHILERTRLFSGGALLFRDDSAVELIKKLNTFLAAIEQKHFEERILLKSWHKEIRSSGVNIIYLSTLSEQKRYEERILFNKLYRKSIISQELEELSLFKNSTKKMVFIAEYSGYANANLVTDVMMSYANGVLSPPALTKVEALSKGKSDAIRRMYEQAASEPIPKYLRKYVLKPPPQAAGAKKLLSAGGLANTLRELGKGARYLRAKFGAWLDERAALRHLAAALAAILTVGAGAGLLIQGGSGNPFNELVTVQDGQIFASGALRQILETGPSGEEARIGGERGGGVSLRVTLTFKSMQETYCREYEIATPHDGNAMGLGCRDSEGRWKLEAYFQAAARPARGAKPAAPTGEEGPSVEAIIDKMIAGEPLLRGEETTAIKKGWR